MTQHRASRFRLRVLVVLAGCMAIACTPTEGPTALRTRALAHDEALPTILTVADNDRIYTLDVANNRFTTSDGVSVTMDPEVTALVAQDMVRINETDPAAADLFAAATAASGDDCLRTGICMTLRAGGESTAPPPAQRAHQRRVKPFHLRVRRSTASGFEDVTFSYDDSTVIPVGPIPVGRTIGGTQRPSDRQALRFGALRLGPGITGMRPPISALYGDPVDPCTDIINAGLGSTIRYATHRTSALGQLVGDIVGGLLNNVAVGTDVANRFAAASIDSWNASIAVGVLAYAWDLDGCANRYVAAGPIMRLGPTQTYHTYMNVKCHYEWWLISFGEGGTQYSINVKVCEVAMT